AYFSSYQEAGQGPTGQMIPWITAPGATVVAGVNHYHTSGGYIDNSYASSEMYRVNSSTTNPYGSMEGTSMATPVAAGVVALWLQAAKETNQSLSTSDVKNIMKNTAITDNYTKYGANASHFGNGKINALGGIQAILGTSGSTNPDPEPSYNPELSVSKTSLSLATTVGAPVSATFTVAGTNLTSAATVSLTDANGVFSVTPATISTSALSSGKTVTVTFNPQSAGTFYGKVTVTSGTASTSVNLTASATQADLAGGTASDNYLDLHKYSTIDDAGVYGVNNFYSIVNDGNKSWISIPAYGAYYSAGDQAWISSSNIYTVRTTWSRADVFGGYSSFFSSSNSSRAITSSSYGSTAATETFYVTNCSAVKLYGYGRSTSSWYGRSSAGSLNVKAYECAVYADGSLSASSTVAASASSTTAGATATTMSGLDASKVYKVVVTVSKSYLYEIAFQTTLSSVYGNNFANGLGELSEEANGIENVESAESTDNKIYTINGVYVGNDIKVLPKGMYIINGKKVNVR
nr:S8 family serine peptidase [Bacteroidaceae bacterium]